MIFQVLTPIDRRKTPSFTDARETGCYGERVAEAFLKRKGYQILVRNYQTEWGEIDLVCRHETTLVFVEVKARDVHTTERPASAVNANKQRRLIHAATRYLQEIPVQDVKARFDVVEVYLETGQVPRCELLPSAFVLPRS